MNRDALRTHALALAVRGLVPQTLAPNQLRTTGGQAVANFANAADAAFFVAAVQHLGAPNPGTTVPTVGTPDPQREEIETREALGE